MSRTERLTELDERLVAEAEADLRRLLSIEPSPEFAARVRARIHERPTTPTTVWAWLGVGLAAMAIIVAILRMNPSSSGIQSAHTTTHPDIVLDAPATDVQGMSRSIAIVPKQVAIRRRSQRNVPRVQSPEIVIDAAMTDAIRRMAISLRHTSPDPSAAEKLQIEVGDPAALAVAEPLTVPELVLKPADQNGGD